MKNRTPYLLGLLVWLLFALLQVGFDDPAEHYPTLEAAGGMLFGYWSPPWEWLEGLRSWIQPLWIATILYPFHALGLQDRLWLDTIARISVSFWNLGVIWAVGSIARSVWLAKAEDIRKFQVLTAVAWPLVTWGTRHLADTFCIAPMMIGIALFLSGSRLALAGICMGLAFCLRYTLAFPLAFSILLWLVLVPGGQRLRRFAITAGSAFATAGLLLAMEASLYQHWFGSPWIPLWEFFKYNVLDKMGHYNPSPWWELALYVLLFWCPPLGWLALRNHHRTPASTPRAGREFWPILVLLLSTAAISIAKHKEFRFILPLIPFTLIVGFPFLKGRFLKLGHVLNSVFLLIVMVFYSEPHGGLVRGLDLAGELAGSFAGGLAFAGLTGAMPAYYSRANPPLVWLNQREWNSICRGQTELLRLKPKERWTSWPGRKISAAGQPRIWAVIANAPCPGTRTNVAENNTTDAPLPGTCRLVRHIPVSIGSRLRQKISHTQMPEFVYLCSLAR